MDSLNLESSPPVERTAPKSSATAFGLSLLYPGLGHLYLGKNSVAAWTLVFFTAGATLAICLIAGYLQGPVGQMFGGIGLRAALALYLFGFLDAYFTAGEINSGQDEWFTENPRTAAVLNFLSSGFGYFYLGERTKGLIVFVVGSSLNRALMASESQSVTLAMVVELIMAVLAFDAWRIGRRLRVEKIQLAGESLRPLGPEASLSPVIPQLLAAGIVMAYAGMLFIGASTPEIPPGRTPAPSSANGMVGRNIATTRWAFRSACPRHGSSTTATKKYSSISQAVIVNQSFASARSLSNPRPWPPSTDSLTRS